LRILGIGETRLAAQNDAVHPKLGVPVTSALADYAKFAVHRRGMTEHPGRDLHLGEFYHGAKPGLSAVMNGRHDGAAYEVAGLPVNDPVGALGAVSSHVLVHAGYGGEPGVRLAQDVIGTAKYFGTVPETAAPNIDEPGID